MCHVMITQCALCHNHNKWVTRPCSILQNSSGDLHGVAVEKVLELPLSGRICEIPNIEPTTLISTGSSGVGLCGAGGVVEGSLCQGVGEIVCGSRHV